MVICNVHYHFTALPLATTQPTPQSLAFLMARSMQKLPTMGPRALFPSTQAEAEVSLRIQGTAATSHVFVFMSRTYLSKNNKR